MEKKMTSTYFVSHGEPSLAVDKSAEARKFLEAFQEKVLPVKPESILIISSHWDTALPTVNAVQRNATLHDFSNPTEALLQLKYPAQGALGLALRVKHLLELAGLGPVEVDEERGLDHGAWVPLMFMYPEADIPVCQLSIQTRKDAAHHFEMGRALAPLKDEGVLVVASGSVTHNMGAHLEFVRNGGGDMSWATEFDSWLTQALLNGRYDDVNNWEEKAPHGRKAHPHPDHFYPLHVAMGAAGAEPKAERIHTSWGNGLLSHSCYQFSAAE